ncbi:hypothetical protein CBM2609_A110008 [Cupriavidus taiwanensis]|nr:hypothetical protein CBM2604_A90007 [Cupriavidus taiwanensis]SOZ23403.1 hypothetical protein CBM2609_A110008 [Cupriavidus taiwanensis]SOZ43820.1 hypothetical protein CBM2610_A110008 [Cupriavidus taiwanensis]
MPKQYMHEYPNETSHAVPLDIQSWALTQPFPIRLTQQIIAIFRRNVWPHVKWNHPTCESVNRNLRPEGAFEPPGEFLHRMQTLMKTMHWMAWPLSTKIRSLLSLCEAKP